MPAKVIVVDAPVQLVTRHLPGYPIRSVRMLGEGLDNVAYVINDELILRCAKDPDPEAIRIEARVLAAVAQVSPLPVPRPTFVAPEQGCLAYRLLPGVTMLRHRVSKLDSIVAGLHHFLAVLHRLPVDFVERDDVPAAQRLAEAAACYQSIATHVPHAYHGAIATFLDSRPPAGPVPIAFCHNDLGIEHVLVSGEGGTVTGIIDWGDAALTDPARDYGMLFRDLGPVALPPESDGLRERAVFYARCNVFEDLEYGLSTGESAYVDKSLDSLRWLFPPA